MGEGARLILIAFVIGFFSMFLPIISISGLIIGTPFIVWGFFPFWFGAGQGAVKVAGRAAGVKTDTGRF
jgi:hypothetical protein